MPGPLSASAAPLTPGVGRAPVRPTPGTSQWLRAEIAVERGVELACMVRDEGADSITTTLRAYNRHDLEALAVALAAMVPLDRPVASLLEWTNALIPGRAPRTDRLAPCGTRSAFARHKARGETVDDACAEVERAYQRARVRRRSA